MSLATRPAPPAAQAQQVELTADLAWALAADDDFRAALLADPAAALAAYGVQLRPGQVPARVRLPDAAVCREKLGVGPPSAAGASPSSTASAPSSGGARAGAVVPPGTVRLKRQHFTFLRLHDRYTLDVARLLSGELAITRANQVLGAALHQGAEPALSQEEVDVLMNVPSTRWITLDVLRARVRGGERVVDGLVKKGMLIREGDGEGDAPRADAGIAGAAWDPYGALYHYMARWHGQNLDGDRDWLEDLRDPARNFDRAARRHGAAPPPFHRPPSVREHLPLPLVHDERLAPLLRRQTVRVFDRGRPLERDTLAALLYGVFGCQGYAPLGDGVVGLRKTSPSGGSMHPTEAYPLLLRVEGMRPGLYHYDVRDHALGLIEPVDEDEAERLITRFTAGQSYFRSAAALFLLTTRFHRNFWKYRQHRRAYQVLLMDAAHLSQTFYTACTALGLGAFFTAAVNGADIEERLGVDGTAEGAVGVLGCGYPEDGGWGATLDVRPYVPGRTVLDGGGA